MAKIVTKIDTAAEFVERLRPTHSYWLSPDALYSNWGFRGQGNADWPLIPSAWREDKKEFFAQQSEGLRRKGIGATRAFVAPELQHFAENYIVMEFARIANAVGLAIPELKDLLKKHHAGEEIRNTWDSDQSSIPAVFAIAQHHGVPTPLLDFTGHGLIAAFFAAESAEQLIAENERYGKPPVPSNLAVWAMNWSHVDDEKILRREIYPSTLTLNLHAQDGFFMLHPDPYRYYDKHNKWPEFDKIIDPPLLQKFILPTTEVPELLRLLWAEGYYRARLMPSYDSIAISLRSHLKHFKAKLVADSA